VYEPVEWREEGREAGGRDGGWRLQGWRRFPQPSKLSAERIHHPFDQHNLRSVSGCRTSEHRGLEGHPLQNPEAAVDPNQDMTLDLGESSATAAARAAARCNGHSADDEPQELPPAEVLRVQDMLHEFDEVNVLGASRFSHHLPWGRRAALVSTADRLRPLL